MKNCMLLLIFLILPSFATAGTIAGHARVVDGDTLAIGDIRVRLDGIDAPETSQTCDGMPCGRHATDALRHMIGGTSVVCHGSTWDAYDRLIAECYAQDRSLNAAMVEQGHALAFRRYSTRFVQHEEQAQARNAGIWASSFTTPWDYRSQQWNKNATAAPENCPIKGNVSRSGVRIYHTPYSRQYDRTVISTAKGERWFCSEREALDAGWRAPLG